MKITRIILFAFLGLGLLSLVLGSLIPLSGSITIGILIMAMEAGIIVGGAKLIAGKIVLPLKDAIKIIGNIGLDRLPWEKR